MAAANVTFSPSTWQQPLPPAPTPERARVVEQVSQLVVGVGLGPLRVAIDGYTAAGKTSFGHELAQALARRGRPAFRATLDDFKKPWLDRHLYDRESGEGYYRRAHDVEAIQRFLLDPASPSGTGIVALCSIDPLTRAGHSRRSLSYVKPPGFGRVCERTDVEALTVAEAAGKLGLDPSRVRQLLRAGTLRGQRVGRDWLVSEHGVAALQSRSRPPGRPLAPRRAWALLDLLDGGTAAWLDPVARSQVRAFIRRLGGADAEVWAAALRAREDHHAVRGHPAAIKRLLGAPDVWPAGAAAAAAAGADLVDHGALPEIYLPASRWPDLARSLHLALVDNDPRVIVRVPRDVWPFGANGPGGAASAASLLDSGEWRARRAADQALNDLARRYHR